MNELIIAENISKSYSKGVNILKELTFSIYESELFGFLGPDGAGKTSLFRLMATLLYPSSGNLNVAGFDVVRDFKKLRNIIGYMPGRFSLYSDLSVEENLSFFASVFGTTIEENYDLIRDIYVQIEPFKTRLAGRLSGGMKQKLALSCALIHKPKILILDEPTTGVDAVSRKEFWELLKGLKEKGITIVVSTPYMDEAQMCDRVALIQEGEILKVDTPANIEADYSNKIFSIATDDIHKLLVDLRDYQTSKHAYAFGRSVHYTDKFSDFKPEQLLGYLKAKGHHRVELEAIKAGIEDVFIDLMQKNEV